MTALSAARVRQGVPATPQVFFTLAVLVVAVAALPAYVLRDSTGAVVDLIQQDVAVLVAVAMLAWTARRSRGTTRELAIAFTAAFAVGGVGILRWDLQPTATAAPPLTNACLLAACGLIVLASGRGFARELDRPTQRAVLLDAAMLFLGVATVVLTIWQPDLGDIERARELPGVAGGIGLIAASMAGWVNLLARRVPPGARGQWAVIDGSLMVGLGWLAWLDAASRGQSGSVIVPGDFFLSLGVLLLAYGAATWGDAVQPNEAFERFATRARDAFPVVAAVGSVSLQLLVRNAPAAAAATTLGVVVTAAARTILLLRSERAAAARLAWEMEERADTLRSLARLQAADTPSETADRVCSEALQLRGIDVSIVYAVRGDGSLAVLGVAGVDLARDELLREAVPSGEATRILGHAAAGPWAETIATREADGGPSSLHELGLRAVAAAPLLWEDRLVGLVSLGTRSPEVATTLSDRLPTVREFAVVAAALLGPALAAHDRQEDARAKIGAVIADGAFHPVFQPIVDLATGAIVGFEALTRFRDGTRPDVRFKEAVLAGMSLPLEMATLRAALEDAHRLPEGWLSLNVSPDLAASLVPLVAALEGAGRSITLEITEHDAIDDYGRLKDALGMLRADLRIAVDDAGAGYAGLQHILEIRPDFVKLDIGLVRSIDTDLARRAMVASMVTFARDTGCSLIAEGIETADELAALRDLGVQLGQGFHLARPARVDEIETASASVETRPPTGS